MSGDILQAQLGLKQRMQQILSADGWYTDAGQDVQLERFHTEADPVPGIRILLLTQTPDRPAPNDDYYTKQAEYQVSAVVAVGLADHATLPAHALMDLERAALTPVSSDGLDTFADDVQLGDSSVDRAVDGSALVQINLNVLVRWDEQVHIR